MFDDYLGDDFEEIPLQPNRRPRHPLVNIFSLSAGELRSIAEDLTWSRFDWCCKQLWFGPERTKTRSWWASVSALAWALRGFLVEHPSEQPRGLPLLWFFAEALGDSSFLAAPLACPSWIN